MVFVGFFELHVLETVFTNEELGLFSVSKKSKNSNSTSSLRLRNSVWHWLTPQDTGWSTKCRSPCCQTGPCWCTWLWWAWTRFDEFSRTPWRLRIGFKISPPRALSRARPCWGPCPWSNSKAARYKWGHWVVALAIHQVAGREHLHCWWCLAGASGYEWAFSPKRRSSFLVRF